MSGGWTVWVLSGLASYVGVSSSAGSSTASSSAASSSGSSSGVFSVVGILGMVSILVGIVAVILISLRAVLGESLIPWPVLVLACTCVALYLIVMYKWRGTGISTPDYQSGHSFVQMVHNTEYGRRYFYFWFRKPLDTSGQCDVYLITNDGTTGLHWTLLVRMGGLRINLPYLSIEINTDDSMKEMIPTMRQFKKLPTAAKFKGSITDRSIKELCKMADMVRSEMGSYNITSSNCQNFCNEVLKRMNLSTQTTTVEGLRKTASTVAVHAAMDVVSTTVIVVTVATAGTSLIVPFLGIAAAGAAGAALYNRLR